MFGMNALKDCKTYFLNPEKEVLLLNKKVAALNPVINASWDGLYLTCKIFLNHDTMMCSLTLL